MNKENNENNRVIIRNKKAFHDYYVEETVECGIVLKGNEVKSIRNGSISIKESWVSAERGGLVLKRCNITPYKKSNAFDVDSTRDRALLLHKHEIKTLSEKAQQQGYTIVPIDVRIVNGKLKIVIGLCKGKHRYDKRRCEKEKEVKKEMKRAVI